MNINDVFTVPTLLFLCIYTYYTALYNLYRINISSIASQPLMDISIVPVPNQIIV